MDYFESPNIEFLDLSGIDEEERKGVLSSLHSWNPKVKLPWTQPNNQQPLNNPEPIRPSDISQSNCSMSNSNVMLTHMQVNKSTCLNVIQQYPVYVSSYHVPPGFAAYGTSQKEHLQVGPAICMDPTYRTQPMVFYNENYSRPMGNVAYVQMPASAQNVVTFVVNKDANPPNSSGTFDPINAEKIQHCDITVIQSDDFHSNVSKEASYVNITEEKPNDVNEKIQRPDSPCVNTEHVYKKQNEEITSNETNGKSCEENDRTPTNLKASANVNSTGVSPQNDCLSQNGNVLNKSWASLFNKAKSSNEHSLPVENGCEKPLASILPFPQAANDSLSAFSPIKEPHKSDFDDPNYYRMGEFLTTHSVDNRIISIQPRGLINRSNYCYINSILQALIACPPVYNLLCSLSQNITNDKKKVAPIIDGMSRFVKEFNHLPAGMRVGRRVEKSQKKENNIVINCDTPFEPSWIYKILSGMRSDTFVIEGRQEDAEEFLGCLLNGLNDEMLELIKLVTNKSAGVIKDDAFEHSESEKEWQVMGPKNKGSVTRRTEFGRTPISDIFGGLLRSRIHRTGDLSTDNIQPFFTLQLNIEKATTVQEALEILVSKNQLEGVTSSKTNQEVEAWQQVTIEELPIVLVLHLKCFDFKLDGCTKIIKALEFPIDLKIDSKLLSTKSNSSAKEKQYKLFAVVYHDGKEASKGHYITDAYHVGYASWLRYDDASVKAVQEEQVLNPQGTRVPYLLFYRRSDSIRNKI